jgi:cholesterol transport system auxiliary component
MTTRPISPAPTRNAIGLSLGVLAFVLLAGCSILRSGGPQVALTRYAPDPRIQPEASWPKVDWQLAVSDPEATAAIDNPRILVRPRPNELQSYQGGRWAELPSDMVLNGVLQALEDSDRIQAVARQGSGIGADYKLMLDLRRFESEYTPASAVPSAIIELNAKLLHVNDQQVVASRTFRQAVPATTTALVDVVIAFEQGLAGNSRELAGWILENGSRHEREAHP